MSTVLVTGANGYVGSQILPTLLLAGHTVIGVSSRQYNGPFTHPKLFWRVADFTDPLTIHGLCNGVDVVLHLAARKNDERDSFSVNVLGTKALLKESEHANVQLFILCSTQSVKLPIRGIYGQTKLEAENCCVNRDSSMRVVIYRPSVLYNQDFSGIIGTIANMVQHTFVPVFGDGKCVFQPMHIDDFAELLVCTIATPPKSGIYDIGGPNAIPFIDMVQKVADVFVKKPRYIFVPFFISRWIAVCIGYLPRFPITKSNVLGAIQSISINIQPISQQISFHNRTFNPLELFTAKQYFLQQEAKMLLTYFDTKISFERDLELLDHYIRACIKHNLYTAYIPRMNRIQLSALDAITALYAKDCLLRKKLLIAAAIYETHPVSAHIIKEQYPSLIALIIPCIWYIAHTIAFTALGVPLLFFTKYYRGKSL